MKEAAHHYVEEDIGFGEDMFPGVAPKKALQPAPYIRRGPETTECCPAMPVGVNKEAGSVVAVVCVRQRSLGMLVSGILGPRIQGDSPTDASDRGHGSQNIGLGIIGDLCGGAYRRNFLSDIHPLTQEMEPRT